MRRRLALFAGLGLAPFAAADEAPRLLLRAPIVDPPPVVPGSAVRLGGIFSSLYRSSQDPPDVFWAASDRGPNDEVVVAGETRRVFVVPEYDPSIVRVRVDRASRTTTILDVIPLVTGDGRPVTGLPPREGRDEVGYDRNGKRLQANPDGVDPEALVRMPDGTFWLSEEYGPSLLRVSAAGRVLRRYVPRGSGFSSRGYPVSETLPALLAKRRTNRGFESLALSRDARKLFAIVQSPLRNPDQATGDASRSIRLFVLSAEDATPLAEHVVLLQPAADFREADQGEMKITHAAAVNDHSLLVVESNDPVSRVYGLDLRPATNILGTLWDDPRTLPSLEALRPEQLPARGIVAAEKTLVADLDALVPGLPAKMEAVAVVDERTIAVGNDNEFGVRASPEASEILYLELPRSLRLAPVDSSSLANPEEVRPTHMSLDLTLDFEAKQIRGSNVLSLEYLDPEATHLDLDTRGLGVSAVSDAATGQPLPFALEPPLPFLGRRLRIALGDGRPSRVRVEYASSPDASALQWLEPRQTTSGKLPFLLTQSESIHARSFVPCADSPSVRVSFDATLRAPKAITVVMAAEALQHEPEAGIYRFRMSERIPSYLLALAAGEIAFRPLGPRTGVYAEPGVVDRAASEFRDMEAMLRAAESLYGPYAWGRWDAIVLPPSFPFGGMENPRLTFATPTLIAGDRSLVNVMAHELAHSWSGNLVTHAIWGDLWLTEGLTTYLENRLTGVLQGEDIAAMQVILGQQSLGRTLETLRSTNPGDSRLYVDVTGRDPEEQPPDIQYEKGQNFFQMLEARFGRERLDAFLRSYFESNRMGVMSSEGFVLRVRRELFQGDDAAWREARVEEWIYAPGVPANMVTPRSTAYESARTAAAAFATRGALPNPSGWLTAQRLLFLDALPKPLPPERLDALDARFQLSSTGNSEILFAWLQHAIAASYEPAYPCLESFLTRVGRRKFVKPLFEAMQKNPSTRSLARSIYAKARPGYHPLTAATVDVILGHP